MAVQGVQIAMVGGTRQKISADTTDAIAGQSLVIMPTTVDVYLGDSGVTTGNGAKLTAGDSIEIDLDPRESLYAITATNVTLHVLRGGV
jgi:hypothetical protein